MNDKDLAMLESDNYYYIAEKLIDSPEIDFIFAGVKTYIDELLNDKHELNINDTDIEEFYDIFLNKSNEFYQEHLLNLEEFEILDIRESANIIFKFLNNDLPNWIYELTEYENDKYENESNNNEPYDVTKIDIVNNTFQAEYLLKKYNLKELFLSPDYQRKFVWTPKQKSRLIESILIKIPLPIFYIDARDDDKWVVIDGLQRLTTIFTYLDDGFRLSNMEYLKDLTGKSFSKLERKYQRRIEDLQLLCNFIRPNTPADIAFNIFQRINTLGTKLEVQEIRNSMYRGRATDLLEELSVSNEFINIVTEKRIKIFSKRMEDQATILRYLAFKITHYTNYERNNMNDFLSSAMESMNKMNEVQLVSLKNTFIDCMRKADLLFENNPFIKPSKNKNITSFISKSLFESISFSLDKYTYKDIEENHDELLIEIYKIYKDDEFIMKTSIATNNPPNVRYRFEIFENIFKKIIGY